jgi:hypothetical protein
MWVAKGIAARLVLTGTSSTTPHDTAPHHHPQVDLSLYHSLGGHEKLLATATGIFKKLGALRAL